MADPARPADAVRSEPYQGDTESPARTADTVPTKWRKRPVVIEAMRLTWENRRAVAEWCGGDYQDMLAPSGTLYAPGIVKITTLEGDMWADEGDWVIKGVADEFYPCKPAIFAATYERHIDGGES